MSRDSGARCPMLAVQAWGFSLSSDKKGLRFRIAGACNHPNLLVLPFRLSRPSKRSPSLRLPRLPFAYFARVPSAFSLARARIWAHPFGMPWR